MIHALCRGTVGIITANSARLTHCHFAARQIREDIPRVIYGMEGCGEFRTTILEEKGALDSAAIEAEVLGVAARMQAETTDLCAILLECSDLPPYAAAIQDRTGLPVHDLNTLIRYLRDAVRQRSCSGCI
ncbi:hypothetical protein [Paracoccus sp. MC1854]|uniref:hypothetical protein n=1 Tax=Paracoccus sp. MC1854 TaxID=2760306 RepID=UPI001C726F18|nr:hypothetical protein [Paracoccus sp. MC1854]